MHITWFGHSCFTVESGGYTLLLDPFEPGSVPGTLPVQVTADAVLCSHRHFDHNYAEAATLKESGAQPIRVTKLETYHDDTQGSQRGPNTIHILEAEGLRIAHLGDLGCMPTEEQLQALSGLDALLIPVGGYYTINAEMAKTLVSRLEPRVVIPMHFKGKGFGFPVLGSLEQFTGRFCSSTVQWYGENTLQLTAETPHQVAVLSFPMAE